VLDNIAWRTENEAKIEAWLNGSPPPESSDQPKITHKKFPNVNPDVIAEDRGFMKKF